MPFIDTYFLQSMFTNSTAWLVFWTVLIVHPTHRKLGLRSSLGENGGGGGGGS